MSRIHPTALVDPAAKIGADVEIGPFCIVGPDVEIGAGSRLISNVRIEGRVTLGAGNEIHPGAVIGGLPQIKNYAGARGEVRIGAKNVFRENVTINTGSSVGVGVTTIGDECYFMTGAHVGHDCRVGDRTTFANCATLGGHVVIGSNVFLGGLCAVHQFNRVGDFAIIGGLTPMTADVIPYGRAAGNPVGLAGLNMVGLKRSGLPAETISRLKRTYMAIFHGEGTFAERLERLEARTDLSPEEERIRSFLLADRRREICQPRK